MTRAHPKSHAKQDTRPGSHRASQPAYPSGNRTHDGPRRRKTPRTGLALLVILVLAALLRALYLADIADNPDFAYPQLDAKYHHYWARTLATGDGSLEGDPTDFRDPQIRTTPYFRPPGYPYFLALIDALAGTGYLIPRIVQMTLGVLTCLLAFRLGERWFDSAVGLIFAAGMATCWVFIYYEGEFLEPVLLIPLSLLLIHALFRWSERPSLTRALLAGAVLGLLALVRPTFLPFGAVALAWAGWIAIRRRQRPAFLLAALGLGIGAVPVISLATVRNYCVARDFVLISSNAGLNLYFGNNEHADGFTPSTPDLGVWTCDDYPDIVRQLETRLGKPMKYSEVSSYFARLAWEYMKTHPRDVFRLMARKALLFWGPKEVSNEKEDEYERLASPVLRYLPLRFPMLLALAVVGVAMQGGEAWSRRRRPVEPLESPQRSHEVTLLIVLFIATYFLCYLPFLVAGRYRVPVIPFLILFGAYGLVRLVRFVRKGDLGKASGWTAATLALWALASVNFAGYEPDEANWHFMRGAAYHWDAQTSSAIESYRKALQIKPDHARAIGNLALAYNDLGESLEKQHRDDDAISEYSKAVALKPDFARAHFLLARLCDKLDRQDEALRHARRVLEIDPRSSDARIIEAAVLIRQKQFDDALTALADALQNDPDNPLTLFYQGIALSETGQIPEAVAAYRKSIQLKPDEGMTHNNLAVLLYFKEEYAEAWQHVQLSRQCGYTPAPDFIAHLSEKMPEPHSRPQP